jgi:prepilin-type N-terminal cleavage/methylation domain-containing protein/prepilin-type processing-associated H-X9-DG protein
MTNRVNNHSTAIKRGFTLIELLTVIAIIGILAAILIPVVNSVRDSARQAVCSSNLRQISLAMIMYADDHNGVLPTSGDMDARPTDWIQWRDDGEYHRLSESVIVPYLGGRLGTMFSPDIFRCPSDENIEENLGNPIGGWAPYSYSYTMNMGISERSQLNGRLYNVKDPTHIIMLVEEGRPNDSGAYLNSDLDFLTERHGGKGHVSFLDAHVRLVYPEFADHPANWDPFYQGRPYTGPR